MRVNQTIFEKKSNIAPLIKQSEGISRNYHFFGEILMRWYKTTHTTWRIM